MKKLFLFLSNLKTYTSNWRRLLDFFRKGAMITGTSVSGIETGSHIYIYYPSFITLSLYVGVIVVILSELFVSINFKNKHHKKYRYLRLLNLLIFTLLIVSDCWGKGEFRPEYLIPFTLELAWEIIHRIFG